MQGGRCQQHHDISSRANAPPLRSRGQLEKHLVEGVGALPVLSPHRGLKVHGAHGVPILLGLVGDGAPYAAARRALPGAVGEATATPDLREARLLFAELLLSRNAVAQACAPPLAPSTTMLGECATQRGCLGPAGRQRPHHASAFGTVGASCDACVIAAAGCKANSVPCSN